ncbi:MAG: hypothetical protein JWO58_1501 [Chitinophagaceae bacterium]|nr:hypothetical protein [Chitinophagaceae bacterium]
MKNFLIAMLCLLSVAVYGQQLDQIGKKGGIKVSGGVGLSNNFYVADGIQNRLNPYYYVLTGNVNISIYGFSLPFSFSFSNQTYSYRQPFNIVGLSPTYKRFTFHAGYRNLSFSPYTLNGHNFLGGGVEYRGDKLNVVGMGGRFLKAVEYDSTNKNALPAYQRLGAGLRLNYHFNPANELALNTFYAKDQANSINSVPYSVGLTPQENLVWSISGKNIIATKLTLQYEAATSIWTQNQGAQAVEKVGYKLYPLKWNQSTVVYHAYKVNATYAFSFMNLGAGYERIDPEYRTLGAYYFNNDLENVTLNFSTALFKKKVNISGNGGLQHDDLNHTKASSMKRKVGSLNIGIIASKRVNVNLSYSNFYSFVNVKPVDAQFLQGGTFSQIDTLNYTQVAQTITGSVNYKISENDNTSSMVALNASRMDASNKQGNTNQSNQMLNGSLMFNQIWKKTGINLGVNTNANQTSYAQGDNLFVGAGITGGVPVYHKKVRVSLGANINENFEKGELVARLFAITNSYSVRVGKKHSINASARYSGRAKVGEASLGSYNGSFNEFIGSLGYNYTF